MGHDIDISINKVTCAAFEDGIKLIDSNSIAAVNCDCPVSLSINIDEISRVLKDDGFAIVRGVRPGDISVENERFASVGLKGIKAIKTTNFYTQNSKFDYEIILSKNGCSINLPDEIIHPHAPHDERICIAQRDVETYEDLILLLTIPGDTVLELCAGSASFGVAAIRSGRSYIGFDNNKAMTIKANNRIAQEVRM